MSLYEKMLNREEKISLIGLDYVGMPIAVSFSKKVDVIGFDLNKAKIELYKTAQTLQKKLAMTQSKHAMLSLLLIPKDSEKQNFYVINNYIIIIRGLNNFLYNSIFNGVLLCR